MLPASGAIVRGEVETKQLASLVNDMDALRRLGEAKGICDSRRDIGKSDEHRSLWLLKVGKGEAHKVLFTGCHHAREWIAQVVRNGWRAFEHWPHDDAPSSA